MRIAFYAPLKPPDHPVPSGDRRMAQLLGQALARAGHTVELTARLRSYDGGGDADWQRRLAGIGRRLAARLVEQFRRRAPEDRPGAWFTYHLYYKAPDWIGPHVAEALDIPYLVAEASVAMKRAGGPWSLGHEAVVAALRRADAVVSLNPADDEGLLPHLRDRHCLHHVAPFLDGVPFARAAACRADHRRALARAFRLDPNLPWLIAVAMMRPGDKLASYRLLGEALAPLRDVPWQLLVIGDGPARESVEAALAPLGERVRHAGALAPDRMPQTLAATDLFVWPAVNEAWGMAILEAQAAGLPVVAGRFGGVAQLVADGRSGILTPPHDVAAFTKAVRDLLESPQRRTLYAAAALAKVAAEHDMAAVGATLDAILAAATKVRA
jgi:glycosyltransferase involved in cell wall biosynthesis